MMVQEEASKERHPFGGKTFVKSTSAQERTPTIIAPPTGTYNVPTLESSYESCRFARFANSSERTEEATFVPIATGSATQGFKVRDHVLLKAIAVIKGTPLHTLADSGATHSFIDEKLYLHPPLHSIGAYSSLEMANCETIVSIGIAPYVVVSIGKIQFRSDLTIVPVMEALSLCWVKIGRIW